MIYLAIAVSIQSALLLAFGAFIANLESKRERDLQEWSRERKDYVIALLRKEEMTFASAALLPDRQENLEKLEERAKERRPALEY